MSALWVRARPQMTGPSTLRAISWTASKSPGEVIGKPASITSTPSRAELLGDLHLLGGVQGDSGRLLAVSQRGVKDVDAVGVGRADSVSFGPTGPPPSLFVGMAFVSRGYAPPSAIPPEGGGEGEAPSCGRGRSFARSA